MTAEPFKKDNKQRHQSAENSFFVGWLCLGASIASTLLSAYALFFSLLIMPPAALIITLVALMGLWLGISGWSFTRGKFGVVLNLVAIGISLASATFVLRLFSVF